MANHKFMIVEDNDATMLFFTMILKDLEINNVTQARTCDEALALAKDAIPNFLVVSWELKTIPGTLLVQKLRTHIKKRHLPYILYSKRLAPEDLVLVKEMGLKNVLSLPIDKAKATEEIRTMIQAEESLTPEELILRKIEGAIQDNRPSEALKYYDNKLRKKGPHSVRANTYMGDIWMMTNQFKKAEESYKLAIAEDPAAFEALNGLANAYSRLEQHENALKILTGLSENSPKNLTTLMNLGSTYAQADRLEEAKKTLAKVSTIDPDMPGLKEEQAKIAFKEGDLSLAAKLIAETQQGDSLARHFNNLAISYSHKNQFEKAVEVYQNAIKMLVNKAKLYALKYNLGLAYMKKGDLALGFKELAESYKEEPTFEKAYMALAKCTKEMTEKGMSPDPKTLKEIKEIRSKSPESKAS
jgi:tetratricopeptide (TPR) repeat protein